MRVAVVAETFHPAVNGVSGWVSRVIEHLRRCGHETLVIAPGPGAESHLGVPVLRTPSFRPPVYRSVHVGRSSTPLVPVLREFRPDVVHLASPALLGLAGARAAAPPDFRVDPWSAETAAAKSPHQAEGERKLAERTGLGCELDVPCGEQLPAIDIAAGAGQGPG